MRDRLKIISDGTRRGTQVLLPDGTPLQGVTSVSWHVDVRSGLPTAHVSLLGPEIEAVGDRVAEPQTASLAIDMPRSPGAIAINLILDDADQLRTMLLEHGVSSSIKDSA